MTTDIINYDYAENIKIKEFLMFLFIISISSLHQINTRVKKHFHELEVYVEFLEKKIKEEKTARISLEEDAKRIKDKADIISSQQKKKQLEQDKEIVNNSLSKEEIIDKTKNNIRLEIKFPNRCQAIKKNGTQCKQCGKETQGGGPIINGYCNYHKKLRQNIN